MKYIITIILLVGLRLGAMAGPPTMPGRLVLKLKPAATPAAVAAALRTLGATGLRQKFPQAAAPNPELPGSVD
ncbi:MAG: hypothetical protein EOO59_20460, partial [Hymenobacter sp.]